MNLASTAPGWLIFILVALLVLAAAEDAWRMRISDPPIVAILIGAVVAAVTFGPSVGLWQNLALFAGLLAIGTAAFAAGKLGGGDVKLMAATSAWFDLEGGLWMVICTLLAGGVLVLIILLLRVFEWPQHARSRIAVLRPGSGIPYGIAIAAGSLIAISR